MKLPESVPQAVVVLDKPRTMAFTFGAMRRIKQVSGHSLDDPEAPRAVTDVIGFYIWALLVEEDRGELTVENVWDLLHPGNIDAVTASFTELVGAGTGNGSDEGKAPAAVLVEASPSI